VLESVPADRAGVENPPAVDTTELSPCRSPSTPRHLRYRQPGGKNSEKNSNRKAISGFLALPLLTVSLPKYLLVSVIKINCIIRYNNVIHYLEKLMIREQVAQLVLIWFLVIALHFVQNNVNKRTCP
jgi:hypothetical protein